MLGFGPHGTATRAGDAPPPSAKARWTAQQAEEVERQRWGPSLEERIQGWRRSDRFDEIRSAVDDALERFPEPFSVALVVGAVKYINRDNVQWNPKPADLDAWNLDVARRALERLPRPPRARDHLALVERGVLGRWTPRAWATESEPEFDVGPDLSLVVQFTRRLLDDEDRLWRPLPIAGPEGHYAPVRRTDPRFRSMGAWDTPTDESAFLAYEERWYERALRDDEWRILLDVRRRWSLLDLVETFAARFPSGSPADAAFRERMPAEVPEFPWIAVLDVVRRETSRRPSWAARDKVSLRMVSADLSRASARHTMGRDLVIDVLVLNRSPAPTEIPLPLARAAILYGPHDRDDEALPPARTPLATDLVTVAPGGLSSLRLSIPVRRPGLARIVVALDNDVAKVGEHVGVWTGSERFVGYVEIPPVGPALGPERLRQEARESARRPDTVDRLCREVAMLAKEQPDDRAVVPLSLVAVDATDARIAHAALAALEALAANGGGVDAYGAFAPIAADATRPRDLRLRAVDGLAGLAKGRIVSRTDVGPQVRDVCDLPIPRRVVDHVRARLEALSSDPDVLVAERARAALGR